MARYNKGILGGFLGTIGNVVGSTWRGITYMRSKPTQVRNPNTIAQQTQRTKFRLVLQFLRTIKLVIQAGFKSGNQRLTPMNRAASYHLKNAVTGTYPDLQIDFPSVLIARGDLTAVFTANAASEAPGQVTFTWTDNSGTGSAQPDDGALLLVYSPELRSSVYVAGGGPDRQAESYTLDLPDSFNGKEVETYLSFVSADGREAADSLYLGTVEVAEAAP